MLNGYEIELKWAIDMGKPCCFVMKVNGKPIPTKDGESLVIVNSLEELATVLHTLNTMGLIEVNDLNL